MAELSAKQVQAIDLLATSRDTMGAIAEQVGVTRVTIHTWLSDPTFSSELSKITSASLQTISASLTSLSSTAANVIAASMALPMSSSADESRVQSLRLKAAFGAVDRLIKIREVVDQELRLDEMVRRLDEIQFSK